MFVQAVREADRFTRPHGAAYRDRALPGGWGYWQASSVLVNEDGWIVTSYHHVHRVDQVRRGPGTVCRSGFGGEIVEGQAIPSEEVDVYVGRVEPFEPEEGIRPARFLPRDAQLPLGASLCSVGCHQPRLDDYYDRGADAFDFGSRWPHVGLFPVEGTLCRVEDRTPDGGGPFPLKVVLTSRAAHHGSSGGPVVDTRGTVCGVTLRHAAFEAGEQSESDRPFHVAAGAHVHTVLDFLDHLGVDYHTEPPERAERRLERWGRD